MPFEKWLVLWMVVTTNMYITYVFINFFLKLIVRWALVFSLSKWGNWDTKRLSSLLNINLVTSQLRHRIQAGWPGSRFLLETETQRFSILWFSPQMPVKTRPLDRFMLRVRNSVWVSHVSDLRPTGSITHYLEARIGSRAETLPRPLALGCGHPSRIPPAAGSLLLIIVP